MPLGWQKTEPRGLEGRRSSLKSTITLADGTIRSVTLQGVGCRSGMCSRVRARSTNAESMWLDGLVSVSTISSGDASGPVETILRFKDGAEGHASIVSGNRVLYLQRYLGFTEKLDLGSLRRIDFE